MERSRKRQIEDLDRLIGTIYLGLRGGRHFIDRGNGIKARAAPVQLGVRAVARSET